MNRVVHFEIYADEAERAATFYSDVFGWKFEKWDNPQMEYWMVMTAPKESKDAGINGGMMRRSAAAPSVGSGANAFVCTIDVADFDATAKKIEAAGGRVATPKYALVGMAWQGYFFDTEGNTFGIHQADSNAK